MKTSIFILALMLSTALNIFCQSQIIPLWPDGVPNAIACDMQEKSLTTDCTRISMVTDPSIEVFLPSPGYAQGQAVLICPGGGYGILAYDKEGTDIAKWLNSQGIAGIVLKYRLPENESNQTPHLSPLMDAKRGMEIIRENASQWNINLDQIGVMGFSAGGHLASTLGTHFDAANRPDFMILMYPVVTMKSDYTHMGSRENLIGKSPSDDLINLYSNELQVKSNTPPTFILHSGDDMAVPIENSLQLYKALKDQKISTEMHIFPHGGHGYGLALTQDRLSKWPLLLADWLKGLRSKNE